MRYLVYKDVSEVQVSEIRIAKNELFCFAINYFY